MNETVLTTIAITGFGIAFFHAAIPTHWLPFVLAARTQRWNHAKTLGITALAGGGHVLFTALLGFLLAWFGIALNDKIGAWFPRIAGGALLLFGLFYLYRQAIGKGHSHTLFCLHDHDPSTHEHDHEHEEHGGEERVLSRPVRLAPAVPDRVAISSLLALLTFSPCEAFLPIYVSGVRFGWTGFALLTAILSIATVAGMVGFTWLTLAGMKRMQLSLLERYESGLIGALLCMVGVLIILFEK